jgi:hypothetical protein
MRSMTSIARSRSMERLRAAAAAATSVRVAGSASTAARTAGGQREGLHMRQLALGGCCPLGEIRRGRAFRAHVGVCVGGGASRFDIRWRRAALADEPGGEVTAGGGLRGLERHLRGIGCGGGLRGEVRDRHPRSLDLPRAVGERRHALDCR